MAPVPAVDVKQLRHRLKAEPKPFLLDVREPWEYGYAAVSNVEGGTAAWIEHGYPVERSSTT